MKDWRLIHREMAIRERRELLIPDATPEQFRAAAHRREIPPGSVWLWSLGAVGPKDSVSNENQWWNK